LDDPTVDEIKLELDEETVKNVLTFMYLEEVENIWDIAENLLVVCNKVDFIDFRCNFSIIIFRLSVGHGVPQKIL
jgi:hypothetical protein